MQGPIQIAHSSKSVANNRAVHVSQKATLIMEQCIIESKTGSGLVVEGGQAQVKSCVFRDVKENGIAAFDYIDIDFNENSIEEIDSNMSDSVNDSTSYVKLEECVIESCGINTVLASGSNVLIEIDDNTVLQEKKKGINLGRSIDLGGAREFSGTRAVNGAHINRTNQI